MDDQRKILSVKTPVISEPAPAPEGGSLAHEKPPRVHPKIKSAPKIMQMYWCNFPRDAQLPEMWKQRPVVVISPNNKLYEACTVIPTSTDPADANRPFVYTLTTRLDERISHAICDFPITIATSRLEIHRTGIPRVTEPEFQEILKRLYKWLPQIRA